MRELTESGMVFRFDEASFCHIEKEKDNLDVCRSHVMACEYIVCPSTGKHTGKVLFIEAKSSAPNKSNCVVGTVTNNGVEVGRNWKLLSPLDIYARDIATKFIDSFSMWQALHYGLHPSPNAKINLPENAHKIKSGNEPVFILVINNFKDEWLDPVKYAIENELRHFMKAWNIAPTALKVVTPVMARDILAIDVEVA